MRRQLMDILVCPQCRSELALTVDEERDGEIIAGRLQCQACGEIYPIEDAIPNMLPPALRD